MFIYVDTRTRAAGKLHRQSPPQHDFRDNSDEKMARDCESSLISLGIVFSLGERLGFVCFCWLQRLRFRVSSQGRLRRLSLPRVRAVDKPRPAVARFLRAGGLRGWRRLEAALSPDLPVHLPQELKRSEPQRARPVVARLCVVFY